MITCPDQGVLRAWLDADADTPVDRDAVAVHLEECARCRAARTRLEEDAHLAAATIGRLDAGDDSADVADPDLALRRVTRRLRVAAAGPDVRRRAWGGVAAAVAVFGIVALVATPTGRATATSLLSIFRSERIEVVTFDPERVEADVEALGDLGEVSGEHPEPVEVADLDAAAEVAGFAAATLEEEPDGTSAIWASAPGDIDVTFSAEEAPDLPDALDGAVLRISVPGTVVQTWGAESDGRPGTVVGEATAPVVRLDGAELEELRAYLLDRPGLSPDLVAQLEAMSDWRTTLPIPVPADGVAWEDVTVGGAEGVAFGDESGLGSAVIWQDGDRIHGVGGTLGESEAMALAESLRAR